jgi:hypothetical protein
MKKNVFGGGVCVLDALDVAEVEEPDVGVLDMMNMQSCNEKWMLYVLNRIV